MDQDQRAVGAAVREAQCVRYALEAVQRTLDQAVENGTFHEWFVDLSDAFSCWDRDIIDEHPEEREAAAFLRATVKEITARYEEPGMQAKCLTYYTGFIQVIIANGARSFPRI